MGGYRMERDTSIKPFSFTMCVLGSKIRCTTVKKLAVTALKFIMTLLFVNLDMFAYVITYIFLFDS